MGGLITYLASIAIVWLVEKVLLGRAAVRDKSTKEREKSMTTTAKLFSMSLLSAAIVSATTCEMLGAASNSGVLGTGPVSGALAPGPVSGVLGTGRASGALGTGPVSGALGTGPTSGALAAAPISGVPETATNSAGLGMAPAPGAPGAAAAAGKTNSLNVVPVITGVSVVGSNLVASGIAYVTLRGQTTLDSFSAPLTLQPVPLGTDVTNCPVLNLQLGPIHLDLLGLVVDTSAICLTVTAYPHGGLLGQLLCSVGMLLQGGTPLSSIFNGLTSSELNNLLLGITSLLNGALTNVSQALLSSITPGSGATCSVLNLTLGPLNLNLLGLDVLLNNCATGPVTVTITGEHGGLLGNLLCGLVGGNQIPLGTGLAGILGQLLGLPGL